MLTDAQMAAMSPEQIKMHQMPVRQRFREMNVADAARAALGGTQTCEREPNPGPIAGAFAGMHIKRGVSAACDAAAMQAEQQQQSAQANADNWSATQVAAHQCIVSIVVDTPGAPENGYWPLDKSEPNASFNDQASMATRINPALSGGAGSDANLKQYFENRRLGLTLVNNYYGPVGVAAAQQELLKPNHAAVLSHLRQRLTDPAFAASLSPADRAEYSLLVDNPANFVPCKAKLGHNLLPPLPDQNPFM